MKLKKLLFLFILTTFQFSKTFVYQISALTDPKSKHIIFLLSDGHLKYLIEEAEDIKNKISEKSFARYMALLKIAEFRQAKLLQQCIFKNFNKNDIALITEDKIAKEITHEKKYFKKISDTKLHLLNSNNVIFRNGPLKSIDELNFNKVHLYSSMHFINKFFEKNKVKSDKDGNLKSIIKIK